MRGADVNENASFTSYRIDEDYFDTYGFKIIAGKNFSKESAADDQTLAVNETALKLLGISSPDEAIGKYVRFQSEDRMLPITAVFEDYHHKSLRHDFEPMILWNFIPDPWYYTIKYNIAGPEELKQLIASIESIWKHAFQENPFHFFFFDEQFNDQYGADDRLGKIVLIFSLFAVFIACLGLYGLTSFMISKRTKEIGIRKVLGANTPNIVKLLSVGFINLVLLALVVSIPISLYLGNKWLENFAHHMQIEWWIFFVAGMISLGVAFFTVFFQSAKAAMSNPVECLHDE